MKTRAYLSREMCVKGRVREMASAHDVYVEGMSASR